MSEPQPARFLWLPAPWRPPVPLPREQEIVFLLVGTTFLFSGYDLAIFSIALPQIQHSLHIPEDAAGLTVTYFNLAALAALFIAPFADIFGRRRLLLFTVFGEAAFTVASAFSQTYPQFVALQVLVRVFGYCEELLCFVVIAEEIDAGVRGWSNGTLGAMNATGAGLAALLLSLVNLMPFGWRTLYAVGGGALFVLASFRRRLRETRRFALRQAEIAAFESKWLAAWQTLARLVREHPLRLLVLVVGTAASNFTFMPAVVLASKYLQDTLHYRPGDVSLLYVGGGLLSVAGNVLAGQLSDRLGRKTVLFGVVLAASLAFAALYAGLPGTAAAWIVAIFGYLAQGALFAGYPAEIFPTAYRASAATLRYVMATLGGASALALEGVLYDHFGSHGAAVLASLAAAPIALTAILFLPEPARRSLEDIAEMA